MKSTLVEPVPDSDESDDDLPEIIRANSVRELAEKTNIGNQEVLDRVLLPGKRFGAYQILGFVAAGGMGEIYAARRMKSDGTYSRPVALKVITGEFAHDWRIIERFKREARISKAISSRHVARVYEFGESPQGHVFMAMELLQGEELFDRLHRRGLFAPLEVADLALQILKGLHRIHDSGYVHRDIKPENIFFANNKRAGTEDVKILDFGIAKEADKKSDPLLSVVGQIYGTPQYIAPEQAINPDVDQRADLYSLGVVMYECVTGSLPFDGQSSYDIIVAHQKEDVPTLPSSIDPEFAEIIYTSLAKSPDERFQSAIEMGRVLKRWRDETSWVEDEEPSLSMDLDSPLSSMDEEPEELRLLDRAALKGNTQPAADYALPPQKSAQPAASGQSGHISSDAETVVDTNNQHRSGFRIEFDTDAADQRSQSIQKDTPSPDAATSSSSAQNSSPPRASGEASTPSDAASQEDAQETLVPPPDSTTEFRSPYYSDDEKDVSDSDARTAQIVTGVALGLLILAILWAVFL